MCGHIHRSYGGEKLPGLTEPFFLQEQQGKKLLLHPGSVLAHLGEGKNDISDPLIPKDLGQVVMGLSFPGGELSHEVAGPRHRGLKDSRGQGGLGDC